ncbi:phosphotransferase enzyme family protein [Thiomicrorhabdus sp.]|uniref:phosphotransferase enzyme family protein n=1 Tax=Thiomicrorhabdus sp. TaxID=2039724 RepID=UPI0029C63DEE|nr:phosphotransferase [Thiomicrorhabdus sp.]
MDYEAQLAYLQNIGEQALEKWALPEEATLNLLSLSENATYRVDMSDRPPLVLRVHRTDYHSKKGIQTELDWMNALQGEAGIKTPQAILGKNGEAIQEIVSESSGEVRYITLFHFIDGEEPDESDLIEPFKRLGEVAGKMHNHAREWVLPEYFDRLVWDYEGCIGASANWGDWRLGPGLESHQFSTLEEVAELLKVRLQAFGQSTQRFGLIHSDIRLANLLICDGETRVIDFDDCGLGWYLYDLASAVSFIETMPGLDKVIEAWIEGYLRSAELSEEEIREIPTFIMLRRLTLLAWLGSHPDADLAKEIGNTFAEGTVVLGEEYLQAFKA